MTLRQLQYFVALAEASNFRRAALRLRVSQPTLTNQIAALERTLSVQLFERSHAGTLLTPGGRTLLLNARRVLEELRGLVDGADSLSRGPSGTYRLGVTPTLGPYLLPYVLPALHRKFDSLHFYVREGAPRDLEDALLAGEHDLLLLPLPANAGDLNVAPLFEEPIRFVVSVGHPLAKEEEIEPEMLRGEPVLVLGEHHLFHHQIRILCERLDARMLRDFEGTSLDTLRQMVVMGMGSAFLPALYVRSEVHRPDELRVMQIKGMEMSRTHALVWRPSSPGDEIFRKIAEELRSSVQAHLSADVRICT